MTTHTFEGKTPQLGTGVYISPHAAVIGNVTLGSDTSIWPFACVRGDLLAIRIGDRTSIQDGCVLHTTHASNHYPDGFGLSIGSDVTVGHKATLHGCTLHDLCLIGMGSIVLDGVVIESEVILGAGSLVLPGKTLSAGYLWAGSPAVQKRPLTSKEREFLRYSAQNYVKLKDSYLK